jgi:23S rRNA (guanosine2251-2'-O)-methyltransferase
VHEITNAAIRECTSQNCGFRYPDISIDPVIAQCPQCGENAEIVHLLDLTCNGYQPNRNDFQAGNIICVLDNIRSVYNVGSLFRTMHGFGIQEAILAGITPTPFHKNFRKTSMGAEENIHWISVNNAFKQCQLLKDNGSILISLESSEAAKSIKLFDRPDESKKIVFIVGNEITGIDPSLLKISDQILAIPIVGKNKSYNVTVAFGIGLFAYLSMS